MKLIIPKLIVIVFLLSVFSCSVHEEIEKKPAAERDIDELNIPEGFDFSTQQKVRVVINDTDNNVKYDVYAYSDEKYFAGMETFQNEEGKIVTDSVFKSDVLNKFLFVGSPINGQIEQTIILPKYYSKLYLRRRKNLRYSASVQNIYNSEVNFTATSTSGKLSSSKSDNEEYFYCVNGSGDLFQINPVTGESVYISDMPMGSYTCAIDQENKVIYSVGRSAPYPLMKYSIDNNIWETVSNLGQGGPRLVFNEGLLYFSSGNTLYTIDPINGNMLNSWKINGMHSFFGGDLAFSNDGSLFLCSFSGVYELELTNDEYQATRISNNLPFLFLPTSMTFDSNNELWLSNFSFNSNLITMDTQNGDWEYKYGFGAGNNTNIGRSITDLCVFKIVEDEIVLVDTDNDGIPDNNDSYPNDSNKAFEIHAPNLSGWSTLVFEDLWPTMGDNDFNDLALNYKVVKVLNANNLVVQLDFIFKVKSNGASFINGLGIEFESILPSKIESVTGNVLNRGYINQSLNGTESDQENAVVILFDNARSMLNKETITTIKFVEPITTAELGVSPFNPFLIVNETREREIHLPYGHTTTLGNKNIEVNGYNRDSNGNYVSDQGLPWAINVLDNFKVPKEQVSVNEAYNFFNQWATSGGTQFLDWFIDTPGNRNEDKLQD